MREEFFNEETGYPNMCDTGEGYESHATYQILQGEIEQHVDELREYQDDEQRSNAIVVLANDIHERYSGCYDLEFIISEINNRLFN